MSEQQQICPITVWPNVEGTGNNNKRKDKSCGKPLFESAKFCEQHEKDRVRLTLGIRR